MKPELLSSEAKVLKESIVKILETNNGCLNSTMLLYEVRKYSNFTQAIFQCDLEKLNFDEKNCWLLSFILDHLKEIVSITPYKMSTECKDPSYLCCLRFVKS